MTCCRSVCSAFLAQAAVEQCFTRRLRSLFCMQLNWVSLICEWQNNERYHGAKKEQQLQSDSLSTASIQCINGSGKSDTCSDSHLGCGQSGNDLLEVSLTAVRGPPTSLVPGEVGHSLTVKVAHITVLNAMTVNTTRDYHMTLTDSLLIRSRLSQCQPQESWDRPTDLHTNHTPWLKNIKKASSTV